MLTFVNSSVSSKINVLDRNYLEVDRNIASYLPDNTKYPKERYKASLASKRRFMSQCVWAGAKSDALSYHNKKT